MSDSVFLWKPLLEAAAQTIIGAIGSYQFTRIVSKINEANTFQGASDFWHRGVRNSIIEEDISIQLDCLISPYSQLFPGDLTLNARRWNDLFSFKGKISKYEYQAIEFFAGVDSAIRIGSLNGETLVGLYDRYGYVGDGIVGVVPTKLLLKKIPLFFHPSNFGSRVQVKGKVSKCPSQHGFVAKGIALKAGVSLPEIDYSKLWYIRISEVKLVKRKDQNTCSLLGSPWAVTENHKEQYLIQYGHLSDQEEKAVCEKSIRNDKAWREAKVYYDDITCPSEELSFRKNFGL